LTLENGSVYNVIFYGHEHYIGDGVVIRQLFFTQDCSIPKAFEYHL